MIPVYEDSVNIINILLQNPLELNIKFLPYISVLHTFRIT